MLIKSGLCMALVCLAAAGSSARAASLYLSGVAPDASMTVTFPGLSPDTTPYVGQINWTFDRSNAGNSFLDSLIAGNTLSTFCIEGTQNVYINQTSNFANIYSDISVAPQDNAGSLFAMGAGKAASLNQFWDAYYGQAGLSNANAAAFQLGIWEILYDTTPSLTTGSFTAKSTGDTDSNQAYSQAQLWLANYTTVNPTTHYELYALSDPNLQDQLFGIPTAGHTDTQPTPLPAALPAGLGLMGALGLWRKLRKRHG